MLAEVELPADLAPLGKLLLEWDGDAIERDAGRPALCRLAAGADGRLLSRRLPAEARLERGDLRSTTLLLKQLTEPTAAWFGPEPVRARDDLARKTLATAAARVKKLLGDDPRDWAWGRLHTATFVHPLASLGKPYEQALNLGPVSRMGDVHTPNNTRHDENFNQIHGASYRQVLDLADWDLGLATSTPGQSGQPGSPHYDDLLPLWADAQYFPLAYSREKVEEVARHKLLLRPQK